MEKQAEIGLLSCPFLRPLRAERLGAFPLGVYCRLPGGRVRVPSRDELQRFCTGGHHWDCLAFRKTRYGEAHKGDGRRRPGLREEGS